MFCECGSVIVLIPGECIHQCLRCNKVVSENKILEYEYVQVKKINREENKEELIEQVKRERICVKCNNDQMYFHTAQIRSADEGQTIFYECTKCGYKETINS
ncbi:rpa12 [Ecytonucleospora hepatopenaei]|uniref:DNA-directed RNA polymerase subunit n=1 Tax=Ecytonucleospora hepatopenaei TaxID=646526 RepID=A0A1W0E981_9MICR|nr:rpa12 [Ecytonucleospora hepatopenaei]